MVRLMLNTKHNLHSEACRTFWGVRSVIQYLEKLVEDKQYEQALDLAERLMLDPENGAGELLRLNKAIMLARLGVNEFYGASVSGQVAAKLAEELGEWDIHGEACLNTAVAYFNMRQFSEAKACLYKYLGRIACYRDVLFMEPVAWYNLGLVYHKLGDLEEAAKVLLKGLEVALQRGASRMAHGLRHALIEIHLRQGDLRAIPQLLTTCLIYILRNNNAADMALSRLYHFELRAAYAIATGRLHRAHAIATRGIRLSAGQPEHLFNMHMILAKVFGLQGDMPNSCSQLLTARVVAVQGKRYDLEHVATEHLYHVITESPADIIIPATTGVAINDVESRYMN